MSQLLNRVVKPLVFKHIIRHNNNKMVRWCSSMTRPIFPYFGPTPIYPYMLLDYILKYSDSGKDSSDGRIAIAKCSRPEQKHIVIKDSDLEEELCDVMTLGCYGGALKVGMLEKTLFAKTNNVRLYIYYKPADATSHSNTVSVRLPHLPKGSVIQNIAMSSSPDLENEDWVVAIKFYGSQIKLYRPCESRYIDVKPMPQCINTSSSLMYSKKDQRFYVPTPGSEYLCSFDLNFKEIDHPNFVDLFPNDLPEFVNREMDELSSSTTTVHFVEAPSGEQFLVKWFFMDEFEKYKDLEEVTHRTRQFMVFRSMDSGKDKKELEYTENIGDLCIFLGHGEPYCVQASLHPGLKPNCIYFMGYNFGVYDISTKCCYIFYTEEAPLSSNEFPYWSHPLSLDY